MINNVDQFRKRDLILLMNTGSDGIAMCYRFNVCLCALQIEAYT